MHRVRLELGALTAALGGLDALVFCGGTGENSASIRRRICIGLEWLGIAIDEVANRRNARRIGTGATCVLVVPTNEERVIAEAVSDALENGK